MPVKRRAHQTALIAIIMFPTFGAFFLASIFLSSPVYRPTRLPDHPTAIVRFFAIGQGDAILLRDADGNDLLVDGGPSDAILARLGEALPLTDRTIEAVVLTHPHADHVNGLADVLERYRVGRIYMTGVRHDAAGYRAFLAAMERDHIPVTVIATTTVFTVGAFELTALWPGESWDGRAPPDDHIDRGGGVNDTSLVLHARYGETDILLMGDASSAVEERLIAAGVVQDVDVLKVGHHGSRYSSSRAFLAAARPEVAVISAGAKNRYGHPTLAALLRLAEAGAAVFRTDRDGDVGLRMDGVTYSVRGRCGTDPCADAGNPL